MRNLIDLVERAGAQLGDLISLKTNDPDADFWIERRGSAAVVGRPSKTFLPHGFGVTVTDRSRIFPDYLYYVMEHLWRSGAWKGLAKGSTNLVNIRAADITRIPLGESKEAAQTPVDAFLADFAAMTEDNVLSPHLRVLDGALVKLGKGFYEPTTTIDIDDIQSHQKGSGTAAMKAICDLADQHGVRLELHAKGYAHVPTGKLMRWYEGFGFFADEDIYPDELDPSEGVDMRRGPKHQGPLKLRGFNNHD